MGILRSLFGEKPEPKPAETKGTEPADPRSDPNLIRVFDEYGRELFVQKEEWRKILLDTLQKNWEDPNRLYDVIVSALNDGFRKDIVGAAKRLFELDPSGSRSVCVWGIVLLEEGQLAEAEKVLRGHGDRHGEDGYVLTNLAKVLAKKGDHAAAETTLWRALQIDPNQETAVGWYTAIHGERGGETASLAALQRLATLERSWRAQLWLARAALAADDLPKALHLYRECLSRTGHPAPPDALMQISGDLGNAGRLRELLTLIKPEFDAATHGLLVGNNLLKAHVELAELEDAQRILEQLYALKRPDWQETLSYWDTEIAKASVARARTPQTNELKAALLVVEGPVWLKPDSPANQLFPPKPSDGASVSFVGSSADVKNPSDQIERQLPDAPGRLSRALPLFFAEQTSLGTDARVRTIIPWLQAEHGFVLFGRRLGDADAFQYATHDARTDYVVVSHLDSRTDDWTVDIRVLRGSDGQIVGQLSETFPVATPTESIARMGRQLRDLLCRTGTIRPQALPSGYVLPQGADFPGYLIRLEQLLAVRCGSMDGVPASFLIGERDIVAGMIDLCLRTSTSVSSRLVLAQTLLALKRVRPDVIAEFRERVMALQRGQPLPPSAANVVQNLIDEALLAA